MFNRLGRCRRLFRNRSFGRRECLVKGYRLSKVASGEFWKLSKDNIVSDRVLESRQIASKYCCKHFHHFQNILETGLESEMMQGSSCIRTALRLRRVQETRLDDIWTLSCSLDSTSPTWQALEPNSTFQRSSNHVTAKRMKHGDGISLLMIGQGRFKLRGATW